MASQAPFQPYASWFGIVWTVIIALFKNFDAFVGPTFQTAEFITYAIRLTSAPNENLTCPVSSPSSGYIGFPVFFILVVYWKLRYGDKTVSYQKMDLISGKEEIDEEEERFLAAQRLRGPQPKWRRIWESI